MLWLCKIKHKWRQRGMGKYKMVRHSTSLMRSEWWIDYICLRCLAEKETRESIDYYSRITLGQTK